MKLRHDNTRPLACAGIVLTLLLGLALAGAPAAIENAGMSRVTTELAPITQRSPIVTPLVTTTLAPIQTLAPIRVGPLVVKPCHGTGISGSSKRWLPSVIRPPPPWESACSKVPSMM